MVRGGGQLAKQPPCFTVDGTKLLLPCTNSVRIYDYPSGRLVAQLVGHGGEVTAVEAPQSRQDQVYTSSLDGTIRLWDLSSRQQLQAWQVGYPIQSMVVTGGAGEETAHAAVHWNNGTAGRVLFLRLRDGRLVGGRVKVSRPQRLVTNAARSHVATFDRRTVLVWAHAGAGTATPLRLTHTKHFTCVAVDAQGARVAAGDVTGRILTWRDLPAATAAAQPPAAPPAQPAAADAAVPPCTTWHWHSQPVGGLAWSADGVYLASGGGEAVFVLWEAASGARRYLPRLGGALAHVAAHPADAALYCAAQRDNTVRVLNVATMQVEMSVSGVLPAPPCLHPPASALQPGSSCVVLPAANSRLQFYDVLRDAAAAPLLSVAPRNLVALTEAGGEALYGNQRAPPVSPCVQLLAFSRDASCLATVDVRPDTAPGALYCLRFWDAAAPGGGGGEDGGAPARPLYRANTTADQPHRGEVTSCSYHPSADVVATTCAGGDFKLWQRVAARATPGAPRDRPPFFWRCRSTGSYSGLPMFSSCFSDDGSLLAVGCAGAVTLWNAGDSSMAGVVPLPRRELNAVQLAVVPDTPYLVVACQGAEPLLVVLHLLTAAPVWAAPLAVTALAVDPQHRCFAVATPPPPAAAPAAAGGGDTGQAAAAADPASGAVMVFSPEKPALLHAWRATGAGVASMFFLAPGTPLHAAAAGSAPGRCSPLLLVTGDRRYGLAHGAAAAPASAAAGAAAAAGGEAQAAAPAPATPKVAPLAEVRELAAALAQQAGGAKPAAATASPAYAPAAGITKLFDAPSHVLPPASQLSANFLELLLTADV